MHIALLRWDTCLASCIVHRDGWGARLASCMVHLYGGVLA